MPDYGKVYGRPPVLGRTGGGPGQGVEHRFGIDNMLVLHPAPVQFAVHPEHRAKRPDPGLPMSARWPTMINVKRQLLAPLSFGDGRRGCQGLPGQSPADNSPAFAGPPGDRGET